MKRFLGPALLSVVLTLVCVDRPAAAQVAGSNGQIVYSSDNNVFVANPDGSKPLLLATDACCASWSPNGNHIALSASAPDGSGRITTATVNPDGSGYTLLPLPDPTLNLGPGSPDSWSVDGTRFLLQGWDDTDPSRNGVYTVNPDGTGLFRVTANPDGGYDVPADYSPDGTRIVFIRSDPKRQNKNALFVIGAHGGPVHQITGWQSFEQASWSPDGQSILSGNGRTLYVVHPDGTDRQQIPLAISSRSFAFTPSWSPDGTKIIFGLFTVAGPGTAQEGIYTANADGSDLHSTGIQGADTPVWGTHPVTP